MTLSSEFREQIEKLQKQESWCGYIGLALIALGLALIGFMSVTHTLATRDTIPLSPTLKQAVNCLTDITVDGEYQWVYDSPEAWRRNEINRDFLSKPNVHISEKAVEDAAMLTSTEGTYFTSDCTGRAERPPHVRYELPPDEKFHTPLRRGLMALPFVLAMVSFTVATHKRRKLAELYATRRSVWERRLNRWDEAIGLK